MMGFIHCSKVNYTAFDEMLKKKILKDILLAINSKSVSSAEMSITFQDLHYFYRNRDSIAFEQIAAWHVNQTILCYCVLKKKSWEIMR